MLSQASEVKCTFLLKVDNELKEVANGKIVNPLNRMFHTVPLGPGEFRVTVARVFPGCGDLDPPYQPLEADKEMKLGECLNWPLKWPKALIRVDPVVRSQTVTPVGMGPSQAAAAPPEDADDRVDPIAADPMATTSSVFVSDDCLADLEYLTNNREEFDVPAQDDRPNPTKKRLFGSQETPEDVGVPVAQAARDSIISPGTLKRVAAEAIATDDIAPPAKKARKRGKKNKLDASSQIPVADVVPNIKWHEVHHLGRPILPTQLATKLRGDMRSLHDGILYLEERLLQEQHPAYPLYVGKVPKGFGFVDYVPADSIFLRFDDIFNMFHQKRLHPSLVRLVTLRMAYDLSKSENKYIAIMDPYYMLEWIVNSEPKTVRKYVEDFMVANRDKKVLLLPYFPE